MQGPAYIGILNSYLCVCVHVRTRVGARMQIYTSMWVPVEARWVSIPLELEFLVVVSYSAWMLGL